MLRQRGSRPGRGLDVHAVHPSSTRRWALIDPMTSIRVRIAFGTLARLDRRGGRARSPRSCSSSSSRASSARSSSATSSSACRSAPCLLIVAGLGMQEMLGREVAKDPRRADDLLWNVVAIKALCMASLLVVIAAVVAVQGRSPETAAAILIVSVGIGFEYQAGTLYAVFDGRERQQYVASTLIVNRVSTALMGIGAALAGAGLVTIAILFTAGSGLGLVDRVLAHAPLRAATEATRPAAGVGRPVPGQLPARDPVLLGDALVSDERGPARADRRGQRRRRRVRRGLPADRGHDVRRPPRSTPPPCAWFSRQTAEAPDRRGFEMAIKTVLALMLPIGLGLRAVRRAADRHALRVGVRRRDRPRFGSSRDGRAVGHQHHGPDRAGQPRPPVSITCPPWCAGRRLWC